MRIGPSLQSLGNTGQLVMDCLPINGHVLNFRGGGWGMGRKAFSNAGLKVTAWDAHAHARRWLTPCALHH